MAIMVRLSHADRDMVTSLFDALDAIRGAQQKAGSFYLSPEENDPNAEVRLDKAVAETALAAQQALVQARLADLGIEVDDTETDHDDGGDQQKEQRP